ncbi:B3 domain-containing protein At3g19184 [Impatiens glandulifera]|uniref:B3 domain-containing protein At3g19184 n=1 Tax=Impatiens glandulifera TaxID=253017 RepID=UPI001FB053E9|nr:B3 domain-containing protein At3g19184 [Impatiens glandulifera]
MVASKVTDYEEIRRKRLEENKKRMQELNLDKLALAVRSVPSPKTSPMKRVKPRQSLQLSDPSAVRRSSRVAGKPPLSYKEDPIEPLGRFKSCRGYMNNPRDMLNRVFASNEERMYSLAKAEELQSSLEMGMPSFVKPMLKSHVTGGFWLGLPVYFCHQNLPKDDKIITLTDENGNEWSTKYLLRKTGLSGGWKGFAVDHELVDGDALVFQLTSPTDFKVYIIRVNQANDSDESSLDVTNGHDNAK